MDAPKPARYRGEIAIKWPLLAKLKMDGTRGGNKAMSEVISKARWPQGSRVCVCRPTKAELKIKALKPPFMSSYIVPT